MQQAFKNFRVPRFTRTLSEWMNLLIESGLALEFFGERKADDPGEWDFFTDKEHRIAYVRLIAFNSMHACAPRAPRAPQSRDRMYVAFWHSSLGRHPDWNKWLRPRAWCPSFCGSWNRR